MVENLLALMMRFYSRKRLAFDRHNVPTPPKPVGGKPCLLYIHIPFCEELCPYCSFNRVKFDPSLAARYFACLQKEIEMYRGRGFVFDSLYVGGGTPTVMPRELSELLAYIRNAWPVRRISVETNANHLTPEIIGALRQGGVNRLSVGVQTFDDGLLARIGRLERYGSGKEMEERLSSVMGVFDTLNADLIFNFPGQTEAMLERDIETVMRLGLDQVTFYPLMMSNSTRRNVEDRLGKTNHRKERAMYRKILNSLTKDYEPASAWCFSRTGGMIDEYIVEYTNYLGLGSGAFGYVDGAIYSNTFSVEKYVQALERDTLPLAASRQFSTKEQAAYDLLIALFGNSLDLGKLLAKYGNGLRRHLWKELAFFMASGAVVREGDRWVVTPRGRYYLVVLMREFFNGVNRLRESRTTIDNVG